MDTLVIILIVLGIFIFLGITITVILIVLRKDKIKFVSCNARFGESDNIIGVWSSKNTKAVVNMYASTDTLTFTSTGLPVSSGSPIVSSTPPNTPISNSTAFIESVPNNKTYNTYFVASDPNDNTNFTVCGPIQVTASLANKKIIISAVDTINGGGITRDSTTNEITYVINNNITPNNFNTWFYNGTTSTTLTVSNKTETLPPNTLSNTDTDGIRYYLYNDNNTLKAGTLTTISNNLSNAQFTYTSIFNWILKSSSNFGIGIEGPIVSGSTITFATPPNDSWINIIVG